MAEVVKVPGSTSVTFDLQGMHDVLALIVEGNPDIHAYRVNKAIWEQLSSRYLRVRFVYLYLFKGKRDLDFVCSVPENVVLDALDTIMSMNEQDNIVEKCWPLFIASVHSKRFNICEKILELINYAETPSELLSEAILQVARIASEVDCYALSAYSLHLMHRYASILKRDHLITTLLIFHSEDYDDVQRVMSMSGIDKYDLIIAATRQLSTTPNASELSLKEILEVLEISTCSVYELISRSAAECSLYDYQCIAELCGCDFMMQLGVAIMHGSDQLMKEYVTHPGRSFKAFHRTARVCLAVWSKMDKNMESLEKLVDRLIIECGSAFYEILCYIINYCESNTSLATELVLNHARRLCDTDDDIMSSIVCSIYLEKASVLAALIYVFGREYCDFAMECARQCRSPHSICDVIRRYS